MNTLPLPVLVHIIAALLAVASGAAMLVLKKGTPLHRVTGRAWVGLMAVTALVSFAIRSQGHFSWIHLLSVLTLVMLVLAINDVRRGRMRGHRQRMIGLYAGLAVAGVFTLLPGRYFGQMLWGSTGLLAALS